MKWLWRVLIGIVVVAVLGYAAVLGWVYVNQRSLQYDAGGKMFALSETRLQERDAGEHSERRTGRCWRLV